MRYLARLQRADHKPEALKFLVHLLRKGARRKRTHNTPLSTSRRLEAGLIWIPFLFFVSKVSMTMAMMMVLMMEMIIRTLSRIVILSLVVQIHRDRQAAEAVLRGAEGFQGF